MLEKINLESGRAHAFLPPALRDEQLYDFEEGGLFEGDTTAAQLAREAAVRSLLSVGGSLVVVEDNVASPGDPYVRARAGYSFAWDDHVYYWLATQPTRESASQLYEVLELAGNGYPTNSFGLFDRRDTFSPFERVGDERLEELATAARAVLVCAYDAESFVVWLRSEV